MGTAMHAGPWGYVTGGGVITGAVASPTLVGRRLSHGNEGSREVSGSTVLSDLRVTGYRIVGWLWEGPLSGPQSLSLKNGGCAPVVQRGCWMFTSWSFAPLCALSIRMLGIVLQNIQDPRACKRNLCLNSSRPVKTHL